MKLSMLNKSQLDEIKQYANFDEEESKILEYLIRGCSQQYISNELNISIATLCRRIGRIKAKISVVNRLNVPIWEKITLTLDEASEYTNISRLKLIELVKNSDVALIVDNRILVKREQLENIIRDNSKL